MPAVSKHHLPIEVKEDTFEGRYTTFGDYTLGFETIAAGMDATESFKGLPEDSCQAEHWGYLVRGVVKVIYADHEEVIRAGQAYYLPPGHIPVVLEEAEIIEFSTTREYEATKQAFVSELEASS